MWTHFLVERYVHNRVITFPGKVRVHRRKGQPDVIEQPREFMISRDEHWENCAPKMREIVARQSRPRDISNATPQRLLDQTRPTP